MSKLDLIKEEIAINLLSKYGYLLESEGEEAANEWLSTLTEEEIHILYEQGYLDYLDKGAEALLPYYRAGKRAYQGDWKGAAQDAATDTAFLALGGIAGKAAQAGYKYYKGASAAKETVKALTKAKKGSDVGTRMANVRNPSAIAKDVALPPSSIKPGPAMPKPANDVAAKMATATSKGADDAVKLATHTSRISKAKEVAKRFVKKPVTAGVAAGAAASSVNRTSNAQQPSSGVELSKALAANPAPKPAVKPEAELSKALAANPAPKPAATPAAAPSATAPAPAKTSTAPSTAAPAKTSTAPSKAAPAKTSTTPTAKPKAQMPSKPKKAPEASIETKRHQATSGQGQYGVWGSGAMYEETRQPIKESFEQFVRRFLKD